MSSSRGCQSALMFCEASVEMKPKVMSWAADRPMVRATARAALSGLNMRELPKRVGEETGGGGGGGGGVRWFKKEETKKGGGRSEGAGRAPRAIAGANCGSGVI